MGRKYEVRKVAMAKRSAHIGVLYNRASKEIYLAAKNGADLKANHTLRSLVEKAKRNQVPSDVIDKAIKKASTVGGDDYQAIRYEGFGPAGSLFIVDALTNNVNRAAGDIRAAFTKSTGKLGVNGSASFQFKTFSLFVFDNTQMQETVINGKSTKAPKTLTEDEIMEALIIADCDFDDLILNDEDGKKIFEITAKPESFASIKSTLENAGVTNFLEAEITTEANEMITVADEEALKLINKLMDTLEENEDVQEVYTNVEL
jgi:YebC/PmpR family DNA-binding regulatory protein